jgi:hypothetical protein
MKLNYHSLLILLSIISLFLKCNIFDPQNQQQNDAQLSDYFGCFPNPFGNSDNPTTLFIYYLFADSDIQIKIYNEQGRLLRKCYYTKNDPQGKKGPHENDIAWDGRDEQGEKVISGVYDAYILTHHGSNYASTKIAVVR